MWMVSILISNSSSHLTKPLGTVPSTMTTIGISHFLIFYIFLVFQKGFKYLSIFSFRLYFKIQENLLFLLFVAFSHHCLLVVFHTSLSDGKSPPVTRTLLSILANLGNSVVWMVLMTFYQPIYYYYYYYLTLLRNFHTRFMIVQSTITLYLFGGWVTASLCKVSRTLLRILADLNHTVVWMVLILISNSSSHLTKPLGTVPST